MVTCWLLIDTIAMSGLPVLRGAAASVPRAGCAGRAAASAGGAAVSAVSAAVAASITLAGGRRRRIASADCAVVDRLVMPMPSLQCLPPRPLPELRARTALHSLRIVNTP